MADLRSFIRIDVDVNNAQALKTLRDQVRGLRQEMNRLDSRKLGNFAVAAQGMAAWSNAMRKARRDQQQWYIEQQKAKTALLQTTEQTKKYALTQKQLKEVLKGVREEQKRVAQQSQAMSQRLAQARDGLFRMRSAAMDLRYTIGGTTRGLVFSLIGMGWAIKNISSNIAKGAADVQSFRNQLSTLLGGPQQGATAIKELRAFALESPLTLKESIEATIRLLNFGHEYNRILRERNSLLETYTKAAVFTGKPLVQVTEAIEKIRSGVLLQRQLTPIGITPHFFENVMGLEMKGKRPVLADTAPMQLYDEVIKALEKKFADFNPSELLFVKLSNIVDRWDVFWQDMGQVMAPGIGKILDMYHDFIDKLIALTNSGGFKQAVDDLFNDVLGPLAEKVFETLGKAVDSLKQNPQALTDAVQAAATAFKGLLAVIGTGGLLTVGATAIQLIGSLALAFTNPVSGLMAAIVLVAGYKGFTGLMEKIDEFIPQGKSVKAMLNDLTPQFGKWTGLLKEIQPELKRTTDQVMGLADTIQNNLNRALSEMVDVADDGTVSLNGLTRALMGFNTSYATANTWTLTAAINVLSAAAQNAWRWLSMLFNLGNYTPNLGRPDALRNERFDVGGQADSAWTWQGSGLVGPPAPSAGEWWDANVKAVGPSGFKTKVQMPRVPTSGGGGDTGGGGGGRAKKPYDPFSQAQHAIDYFIGIAGGALQDYWDRVAEAAKMQEEGAKADAETRKLLVEELKREYDIRQSLVDAIEALRDRLRGLVDGLRSAREGLLVAMHEALGYDKGADRQRSLNLMGAVERAAAARSDLRAGRGRWGDDAYYEKEAQASINLATAVTAVLEFAAGLRDKEGAEDIYQTLMTFVKPYMDTLPTELQDATQTMEQRLTEAGDRLILAAEALRNAAVVLARGELTPEDLYNMNFTARNLAGEIRMSGQGRLRMTPAQTIAAGIRGSAAGLPDYVRGPLGWSVQDEACGPGG